jgi:DNA invertase Pin-like site-specific DNA recombinase
MTLRLVAYIRVSGKSQIDGYGLDIQMADIERAAAALGAEIAQVCSDEGVKGTIEALDREGLACAIDAVREGVADGIIVANLSRLARTLTVQEAALALIWQAEGRAFTADTGEVVADDPDDPMRTAIRQILGVMAQLDRATITLRMRKGREAKAAAGGYAGGAPRYGKKAANKSLVDVPLEQRTVAMILEMHKSMSLRQIAAQLNHLCIPTKRGTEWHATTVQRVLVLNARQG